MGEGDQALEAVRLIAAQERDAHRFRASLSRARAWLGVVDRCVAASREGDDVGLFRTWCTAVLAHTGVPFAAAYRIRGDRLETLHARGPRKLRSLEEVELAREPVGSGSGKGGLDFAPSLPVLKASWCVVRREADDDVLVVVGYDARTARFVEHDTSELIDDLRMSALNLEALSAQLRARAELEREHQQLSAVNEELARRDGELRKTNEELGTALSGLRRAQADLVHNERLSAVGQLAAGIAHEVNNPASYVSASIEELMELAAAGELTADGRSKQLLAEASSGLLRIVGVIRELGRFSSASTSEEVVVVEHLVKSVGQLASHHITQVATLHTSLMERLTVRGNLRDLTQAILNLVINAAQSLSRKTSPEAQRIDIASELRGEQVVISVSDTGPGIPESMRSRVFEPFFTTKGAHQGTGLGLSLAVDIARRHGGSLVLARTGPTGTRFELSLPRYTPPTKAHDASVATPMAPKRSVLLVDDDIRVLRAHARLLRRDYDITVAQSGRAALEILAAGTSFDVILADLMMPEMDGLELWKTVMDRYPRYRGRYFFISGGVADPDMRREIGERGLQVLPKPMDVREVHELVASAPVAS